MKLSFTTILIFTSFFAYSIKPLGKISNNINLPKKEVLNLAVSANLTYIIKEIKKDFEQRHNIELNIITASSGKLSTQIIYGAPFDIFLSANMEYPQKLYEKGFAVDKPTMYAQGLLILFSSKEFDAKKGVDILKDKNVQYIAVPNPKLAPYGFAAEELLANLNLLKHVSKKIVTTENITSAIQYSLTVVDYAFISKSAILSPALLDYNKENKYWIMCKQELYSPIKQGMIILKRAEKNQNANLFYHYLMSRRSGELFCKYGYLHPAIENKQKRNKCFNSSTQTKNIFPLRKGKKESFFMPFLISAKLAITTTVILFIIGIPIAYFLAFSKFKGKIIVNTLLTLPMVLPPTVLGFYLLIFLSPKFGFGKFIMDTFGLKMVFNFWGMVIASTIFCFPFMIQSLKTGMEKINKNMIEASYTLGKTKIETLRCIILPNMKNSIVTGVITTFANTIGAFGVVLMIGGNISSSTKVISIAIFEKVNELNFAAAHIYSGILLLLSFVFLFIIHLFNYKAEES